MEMYARYCSWMSSKGLFKQQLPIYEYQRLGYVIVQQLNQIPLGSVFKPGEVP